MEVKHNAVEMLLYHGTSYEVADAICFQNFDFRLCGKHATVYGKGTYFSTSARYSHRYTTPDSNGHYYMFLAKVLVGRYAQVNVILFLNNAFLKGVLFFLFFFFFK